MAPIALTHLVLATIFFSLLTNCTILPPQSDHYRNNILCKRADLKIKKTTITKKGTTIDWIPRESQGKIATPPPIPKQYQEASALKINGNTLPISELDLPGTQRGPAGTVHV